MKNTVFGLWSTKMGKISMVNKIKGQLCIPSLSEPGKAVSVHKLNGGFLK